MRDILEKMVEINFITHFTISSNFSFSGWIKQRKVMERGGIVVKLTNKNTPSTSLSVKYFVNKLVSHNSKIYEK